MNKPPSEQAAAPPKRALATSPTVANPGRLQRTFESRGIDPAALSVDHHGTLTARNAGTAAIGRDAHDSALVATLPLIAFGPTDGSGSDLELRGTLGEGGMGLIHQAWQVPLRRDVAVKVVRPDRREAGSTMALLREAWVTGALEHPNVVPVHRLARDADGEPLLIMKRIEGVSWDKLLWGGGEPPGDSATLGRDLEVLIAVCNAIAFAHSRNIIHRDLKPANVMVGPFGEVYVLDWGLAVSTGIEPSDNIPRAADIPTDDVRGTPTYMAPEMVEPDRFPLGPATDVYLLGAILHVILTGQPRNEGESPLQALEFACFVEPYAYDASVPSELAAIANRATAQDPADRYPDAAAFRRDIVDFMRHRHAHELAAKATRRLKQLAQLTQEQAEDVLDRRTVRQLLAEARFGFRVALQQWPEFTEAERGLQRTLRVMCDFEVRQGRVDTAESLLEEMSAPPAKLVERVRALAATKAGEAEALRTLRRDADMNVGQAARSVTAALIGVMVTTTFLLFALADSFGWFVPQHSHNVFRAFMFLTVQALAARVTGFSAVDSRVNRILLSMLYGLGFLDIAFSAVCWALGITVLHTLILLTFMVGGFFAFAAATFERRLLAVIPLYVIATAGAVLLPWYAWYIIAAAHAMGPLLAGARWQQRS